MSKYVILEGYECSGKSSIVELLKEKYKDDDRVVFVREPGGTLEGEAIRSLIFKEGMEELDPKAVFCLMQAARISLHERVIKPALESGKVVVSDRSFISSLLYQVSRDTTIEYEDMPYKVVGYDRIIRSTGAVTEADVFHIEASREILTQRLEDRGKENHYDSMVFYIRYLEVLRYVKDIYEVRSLFNDTLVDQTSNLNIIDACIQKKLS